MEVCTRAIGWLGVLVAWTIGAGAASAANGMIEINQARALAGGVNGSLAIDPPGFPVVIGAPGSYLLTSDLDLAVATESGIVVAPGVEDVTIDLGGFTIRGVSGVNVSPPLWQCTGGGGVNGGVGIEGTLSERVTVRNGRVRKMGGTGIQLGAAARIESMGIEQNCGDGMQLGADSVVQATLVRASRFRGIYCSTRCRIADTSSVENRFAGIEANESVISRVVVRLNGKDGVLGGEGCKIESSVATRNGADGEVGSAGLYLLFDGSNAIGNVSNANQGQGIVANAQTGVALNAIDANTITGLGNGSRTDCNLVDGARVCPAP